MGKNQNKKERFFRTLCVKWMLLLLQLPLHIIHLQESSSIETQIFIFIKIVIFRIWKMKNIQANHRIM